MKNSYDRPDTVFLTLDHETYNFATDTWTLADPDSGYPKVTIIDPKGTVQETAVSMDRDATGKFQHLFEILADAEPGWWPCYIDVKNGGFPDREWCSFLVKK